jgi:hypothetical protein
LRFGEVLVTPTVWSEYLRHSQASMAKIFAKLGSWIAFLKR